jgi:hypothetical protein
MNMQQLEASADRAQRLNELYLEIHEIQKARDVYLRLIGEFNKQIEQVQARIYEIHNQ